MLLARAAGVGIDDYQPFRPPALPFFEKSV